MNNPAFKAMKYDDARPLIKNGDVLACSGYWLFSKLIKWWTKAPVSHIGLAVWEDHSECCDRRLCIFEAMEPGGIRLLPISKILPTYWSHGGGIFWCPIKPESAINGDKVIGHALSYWGDEYASPLQFLLIISPAFRAFRRKMGWPMKVGTDRFHCSELATMAFIESGYEWKKEPCFTTPNDVMNFSCLKEPIWLIP